jgi:hypothetical protein
LFLLISGAVVSYFTFQLIKKIWGRPALVFHYGGKRKDARFPAGLRKGAELALHHVAVRPRKVGRVGHIEGFDAKLQDEFLGWLEIL